MAQIVTFNGVDYSLPTANETGWAAALTAFLAALANGSLSDESLTAALAPYATKAGVETLTGKSISGSANTLSNIPNSATTATSASLASTIVARDANGAVALQALSVEDAVSAGELRAALSFRAGWQDASGTPGPATIDAPSGRFAIPVGGTTLFVENFRVTADSLVHCQQLTFDVGGAFIIAVTPSAGGFTIYLSAEAGTVIHVGFLVVNPL